MEKQKIYTTNRQYYLLYLQQILLKQTSYLDNLITDFEIVDIDDLSTLFGK